MIDLMKHWKEENMEIGLLPEKNTPGKNYKSELGNKLRSLINVQMTWM